MECFDEPSTSQHSNNSQMFDITPANSTLMSDITFTNMLDDGTYATTSAQTNPNSVLSRRIPPGTHVISKPNDPILCVAANKKRGEVSRESALVRSLSPVNGKYYKCPIATCERQYEVKWRLTVHIQRCHTKTARVGHC